MASVVPVPDSVHIALLILAGPTTGYALLIGFRMHRTIFPVLAGIFGVACLALGAITWGRTLLEIPVTILGSLAISIAHLTNWRLRRAI